MKTRGNQRGRKFICKQCGRLIGEHGYSNTGMLSHHKCPHGNACIYDPDALFHTNCVECKAERAGEQSVRNHSSDKQPVKDMPTSEQVRAACKKLRKQVKQTRTTRLGRIIAASKLRRLEDALGTLEDYETEIVNALCIHLKDGGSSHDHKRVCAALRFLVDVHK